MIEQTSTQTSLKKLFLRIKKDFNELLSSQKENDNTAQPIVEGPQLVVVRTNSDRGAAALTGNNPQIEVLITGEEVFLTTALHVMFKTFMSSKQFSEDSRAALLAELLLELVSLPEHRQVVIRALDTINGAIHVTDEDYEAFSELLNDGEINAKEKSPGNVCLPGDKKLH